MISKLRYVFFVLLFFPSITFNIVPAEVFPWGLLFFLLIGKITHAQISFLFLFSISVLFFLMFINEHYSNQILRMLGAYINPLLAAYGLINSRFSDKDIEKLSKSLLIIFLIIGLFQFANLMSPLSPLFDLLISRGSFVNDGSIRGVSIFSTEPARASVELLMIYFIYRYKNISLANDTLMFIFLVLIIKSATGIFIFTLMMMLFYFNEKRIYLVSFSAIFLILSGSYILNLELRSRAFMLIKDLAELEPELIIQVLLNTSGPRVFSFFILPDYLIQYPLSQGFGNWELVSQTATSLSGINYQELNWFKYNPEQGFRSFRMPGLLLNFLVDFGLYGLLITFLFFKSIAKKIIIDKFSIFLIAIFCLTGSPGSPVNIIPIIYLIKINENNKKYN